MTDARLQELYREALAARGTAHGPACPEPEALQALVEHEGTEEARLAMLDHAFACASCRRELELLRALRAAAPTVRRPRVASPWLVAASVIVAVAAGTIALRARSAPSSVLRGAGDHHVALIPATPDTPVLRWHSAPRAVSYVVEVMDVHGAVLAADSTADTSFVLPPALRGAPPLNEQWWVRARLADGSELRSPIVPVSPR